MKKVVGFGDYLIHFSPIGDERFMQSTFMEMSFTGAEANVCAALSYWGECAEFVTRLPDHFLAQKGISFLKSLGVKTDNVATGEERMGTYYLENGRYLRPSKVIYDRADSAFTNSAFSHYNWDEIFKDAHIFYVSGITPTLSKTLSVCTLEALKAARERGIKTFLDINYRPALATPEEAKEILSPLMPYITHLIGNEEHFKMIFGIESTFGEEDIDFRLRDVAEKIKKELNVKNVAIPVRRTISASETVIYAGYCTADGFGASWARRVQVIDRVGSGDAFSAGIIYGEIHNLSPKDAVNFASASSAMKHTITKDINFATVEEIQNLAALGGMDVKR